jgi:hypothetical protein
MPKDFPADEFDSVTAPGGRHRAKRTLGNRLFSFGRYALVTVALAAAGITALNFTSGQSQFDLGGATVAQSQFKAGGLGVTVIDATDKSGLASGVAHKLFEAGWNVISATNYSILPKWSQLATALTNGGAPAPSIALPSAASGASPSQSPTPTNTGPVIGKNTVVYVSSQSAQSAAGDVLGLIGKYPVIQANTYQDPITIVLGSDYK